MATAVQPQQPTSGEPTRKRADYIKLYEATDALEIVRGWLVESEGELTPEIEELLAKAEGDFETKIERIALLVGEKQIVVDTSVGTARAIESQAQLHRDRARIEQRGIDSLKAYMQREMEAAERPKVERPMARVRLQKNSSPSIGCALNDHDLGELHAQDPALVNVVVSRTLNTEEVKARFKAEKPLPDGVTVTVGKHVRIY